MSLFVFFISDFDEENVDAFSLPCVGYPHAGCFHDEVLAANSPLYVSHMSHSLVAPALTRLPPLTFSTLVKMFAAVPPLVFAIAFAMRCRCRR